MSPSTSPVSRRTTKLAVPALLAAVCLTGCAGLRPGVAAEVGDDTITTHELDDFASGLCVFFKESSGSAPTSKEARTRAMSILVRSALARTYGQGTSIALDEGSVDEQVQSIAAVVKDLPKDEREKFLEEVRGSLEGDQHALQAADAKLISEGKTPDDQARSEEITNLYKQWAADQGVEIDPRFGTWSDVEVKAGSGSLSVASDAKAADTGPGSQTCG
jgi:hypothetical protein